MDLTRRNTDPEQMDDFSIDDDRLTVTLDRLPTLNRLLGGYAVIDSQLLRVLSKRRVVKPDAQLQTVDNEPVDNVISVLDLGSGIGDIPKRLLKKSSKAGANVTVTATDANSTTVRYAISKLSRGLPHDLRSSIRFEVADALDLHYPTGSFDYVIATQLLHHFDGDDAVRCLSEMNRVSRYGVLINDLHRHALAYVSIKVIVRILAMPAMIVNDAPISVHRGFVRSELEQLVVDAGLTEATVRWHLPFRWSISNLRAVGS